MVWTGSTREANGTSAAPARHARPLGRTSPSDLTAEGREQQSRRRVTPGCLGRPGFSTGNPTCWGACRSWESRSLASLVTEDGGQLGFSNSTFAPRPFGSGRLRRKYELLEDEISWKGDLTDARHRSWASVTAVFEPFICRELSYNEVSRRMRSAGLVLHSTCMEPTYRLIITSV